MVYVYLADENLRHAWTCVNCLSFSLVFLQNLFVETDLTLRHLNGLSFPTEYVREDDSEEIAITGKKTFTGILGIAHAMDGFISSLDCCLSFWLKKTEVASPSWRLHRFIGNAHSH